MATVREHYDGVLAEHYTRMLGDFEAKVTEQRALLERLGVSARPSGGLAVDLGCGSGVQSVALARLGFRVLAIDFSQRLLAELGTGRAVCPSRRSRATSATWLGSCQRASSWSSAWAIRSRIWSARPTSIASSTA